MLRPEDVDALAAQATVVNSDDNLFIELGAPWMLYEETVDANWQTFAGNKRGVVPLLETRACHYESSVDRNFIVDRHPGLDNVWIAGGGSAEGFKFGPVIGDYIAKRVLGQPTDPALDEEFRLKAETFEDPATPQPGDEE